MEQFADAIQNQKWVLLGALIIGALVRLLKVKPELAEKIPPRWRPVFATGLGILWGVLDKVAITGQAWGPAIISGLFAAAIAVWGHDTVIEAVRGGNELLGKDNTPSTVTNATKTILVFAFAIGSALGLQACSAAANRTALSAVLSAADMGCVLYLAEQGQESNATIESLCNISDALRPEIEKLVSAKRAEVGLRKSGGLRDAGAATP